jgi:hypothetical protein
MLCGMRRKVGFFNLVHSRTFSTAFGMWIFTWLVNLPLVTFLLGNRIARGDTSLSLFALVFLGSALYQRRQRKQEKWDPDRPHAYSLGVTRFAFLPLREDYIYRFVDPGITCLIGMLLRYRLGFALLGLYWIVAGLAFCLLEWGLYQRTEMNDWGLGDRRKEAERDGVVLKAMSGQADAQRGSRSTHGIPTGVDGLAAQIEMNRLRNSNASLDQGGEQ